MASNLCYIRDTIHYGANLQALIDYRKWIAEVDRRSRRIVSRHKDQVACTKGCTGNCCRIHISVYPVEAASLALSLQKLSPQMRHRIQYKASHTNSFGPCPLLEDGVCRMYAARAIICRTHGLPMLTEYKGRRSVGFCEKNFRGLSPIPEEDTFDLTQLNSTLAAINRRFVSEVAHRLPPGHRFTIAQALLMDL
jgi:Fe-S-cluster containining protein